MFWKVHRQPTGNELSIGKKRVCSKTRSKTFSQAETQDRLMSRVEEIYRGLGWARPCVRLCRYLKIEHLRLGLMERALKWRREGGHWDVPPPPERGSQLLECCHQPGLSRSSLLGLSGPEKPPGLGCTSLPREACSQ